MSQPEPTRRERFRCRTVAQIKAAAMAQVDQGGAQALSLTAIAQGMSMSASALYRYVGGRAQLLAELAADVHLALAESLEAAAKSGATPSARLLAVADAYRVRALTQPHAYHLAYGSIGGSGPEHATERIARAAQRSMDVVFDVVTEAGEPLEQQNRPSSVREFALLWWTRLHGLISLELGGHMAATGIEPALLYRTEVETMLARLRVRCGVTPSECYWA